MTQVSHNVQIVVDVLVGSLENLLSPAEFEWSLFSNVLEDVPVKIYEELSLDGVLVWSQIRDVLVSEELKVDTFIDYLDFGEYDYKLMLYYDDEVYESSSKINIVEQRSDSVCSKVLNLFY